jgi:hypothetical protein
MKRLIILLCAAAACRSAPSGLQVGTSDPRGAVEQMLAAARAQDLQAITAVWGDERGLVRDRTSREEVESRSFILACLLRSDSHTLGPAMPATGGHVFVNADLVQGKLKATTRFELAPTPGRRWLVTNVDVQALQNAGFCSRPGR